MNRTLIRTAVAELNERGYMSDTTLAALTPSEAAFALQSAGASA